MLAGHDSKRPMLLKKSEGVFCAQHQNQIGVHQLRSRACERQISKLVEHDQVEPRQLCRQRPALADPALLFEAFHQLLEKIETPIARRFLSSAQTE